MTRIYSFTLLGILFLVYSCTHKKATDINSSAKDSSVVANPTTSTIDQNEVDDTSTILAFDYIKVKLTRLIEYEATNKPLNILGDSCYIITDIGETIFGQKIEVLYSILTDVKIEQRFETSVSISNEGPHCDLLDWKHDYSSWLTLKETSKGIFQCSPHPESKDLKFPKVDLKEFLEEVEKHCGSNFVEAAYNIKNIVPDNVGVSRVFIKITGKYNGRTITRTIVIEEAMGC